MPNTSTITALANFISSHPELPFEMREATRPTECGTSGCIGGFAAALWPELFTNDGFARTRGFDSDAVGAKLGLDEHEANALFFPADQEEFWRDNDEEIVDYDEITRAGAISTLRRLAATGEVVWVKEEQL